jgi:hypothetical protein
VKFHSDTRMHDLLKLTVQEHVLRDVVINSYNYYLIDFNERNIFWCAEKAVRLEHCILREFLLHFPAGPN